MGSKVLKVQPLDRHRISPRNCWKQHLRIDDSPQGGERGVVVVVVVAVGGGGGGGGG